MTIVKSMSICHFTTELGSHTIGGVGTYINALLQCGESKMEPQLDIGFVLLSDDTTFPVPDDPQVVHAGFYAMDVLQGLHFDTAIFHSYSLAYLADASFLRGARLIYVIHSIPTTVPWSLHAPYGNHAAIARSFEHLCDSADVLICVSEAERGKLLTLYPDLAAKTSVIHNGSDFPALPARVNEDGMRNRFGFLGRMDRRKGLLELLHEFAKTKEGTLEIAYKDGDRDYMQEVTDWAEQQQGFSSRLEWLHNPNHAEKISFWHRIDALIVPSLWEPFGYVALEALRNGITPLISQNGGMPEIVGSSYRYTFDPYRRGDLQACIETFLADSPSTVRQVLEAATAHASTLTAAPMASRLHAVAQAIAQRPLSESKSAGKHGVTDSADSSTTPTPAHTSSMPTSAPFSSPTSMNSPAPALGRLPVRRYSQAASSFAAPSPGDGSITPRA
jgi:glycosyltransferase involved in cell wall biosynthesis